MRSLLAAALAVVSLGLIGANPASAWVCIGPEYVCGDVKPAKANAKKSIANPVYAAPKKAKAQKVARSYDEDYAPAPKKKKSSGYSAPAYGGSVYQTGVASYYWQPQKVASGGWFNPNAMTAAHKTLPFGTKVRVTNKNNGKSVVVTINDRGPYIAGRVIDLSKAAAGVVGMQGSGIAPVTVAVLGK